ncbi:25389_t:CDS:2 [Gigaspora rosea]|nr:25389_t:CDS:2 [Gigaspora rosea]
MNMLRSNSNNSKSSDRVALLSDSNNDTTSSSIGRKVKHDVDTSSHFEQQNDYRLEELNSKLSALHKITIDIHNEVSDQGNLLDDTVVLYSFFSFVYERCQGKT